jgi:hypothetical protein
LKNLLQRGKRFLPLFLIFALLGGAFAFSSAQSASAGTNAVTFFDTDNFGGNYLPVTPPNGALVYECNNACLTALGGTYWTARADSIQLTEGYYVEAYSDNNNSVLMGTAYGSGNGLPNNTMRSFTIYVGSCSSCPTWVP